MKFNIKEILENQENMKIINESVQKGKYKSLTEAFIGKCNSEREYEDAVFISHKTTQKCYAEALACKLDKRNYDIYLDTEDIGLKSLFESVSNDEIMDYLKYGIDNSEYFFCILSNDIENDSEYGACDSENWIKDEYNYAYNESKKIWGLKLDNYRKKVPSFWRTYDIKLLSKFHNKVISFNYFINNYERMIPLGKKRNKNIFEVLLNA